MLITLNERVSKVTTILNLPGGYTADAVADRLEQWAATMPHQVLASLIWDR